MPSWVFRGLSFVTFAMVPVSAAFAADGLTCDSQPARVELKRQAIKWMKNDQMLDEMADIGSADLSLAQIATLRRSEDLVACRGLLTIRVMYSAGLRRTINNEVTYDLRKWGEDGQVAVRVRSFQSKF